MTDFRNRIVGYGTKKASQFLAHPLNHRKHPQSQRRAMTASLTELGWVNAVIENVRTGRLIDGHERIWQALQADDAEVPFIQVDLAPEEEHLALAILDRITGMAEVDPAMLNALLEDVNTGEAALQELLAKMADEAGIVSGDESTVDAEPQIDKAEELRVKWGVETGQLWELGDHRLACGDCTNDEVAKAVMGEDKADLLLTDPPYGMNLDTDFSKMPRGEKKYTSVVGDDSHFNIAPVLKLWSSEKMAIWGGGWFYENLPIGGSWVIWDKQPHHTVAGPQNHFEECWIYPHKKRIIIRHLWTGYTATEKNEDRHHPTQKPVAVIVELAKFMGEWSTCTDPFLGSGTTLIACEQLGRKCRAIEISPGYVAVALQRWADATGKEPKLMTS